MNIVATYYGGITVVSEDLEFVKDKQVATQRAASTTSDVNHGSTKKKKDYYCSK